MSKTIVPKKCPKCKTTKQVSEFYKDRTAKDGINWQCKSCCKAYNNSKQGKAADMRHRHSAKRKISQRRHWQSAKCKNMQKQYEKTDKAKATHKAYRQTDRGKASAACIGRKYAAKFPDRIKAKNAIAHAVTSGQMQPIDAMKCSCGKQAHHYHHPSYAEEHWLDVIPVCRLCHKRIHVNCQTF